MLVQLHMSSTFYNVMLMKYKGSIDHKHLNYPKICFYCLKLKWTLNSETGSEWISFATLPNCNIYKF